MATAESTVPSRQTLSGFIVHGSGERMPVQLEVTRWPSELRRKRAVKRMAQLFGALALASLIGLVVHILLLVIIPAWLIALVAALPLFNHWLGEEATVHEFKGHCFYCKSEQLFKPYLKPSLAPSLSVICENCGQTSKLEVPEAEISA